MIQSLDVSQPVPKRRTGVLLINVGTPDAPTPKFVRKYLAEFLTDPRVVSLPGLLRYLLVYGLIVPFRTKKSAHAYQSIWDREKGSPLLSNSLAFANALQAQLGEGYSIAVGMRYGNPSIQAALTSLLAQKLERLIVAPLYPQFAGATTTSALESVFGALKQSTHIPAIQTIDAFYREPTYLASMTQRIRPYVEHEWDHILFSYHGLPFNQIRQSEADTPHQCINDLPCPAICENNKNCYRAQCYHTTSLLADRLGLRSDQYTVSFQSRVGFNRWIGPDTNAVLKMLCGKGKKKLLVVCPSFVADCLETLEEIQMQAGEIWLSLGGESFTFIPCLNDSPFWVENFAELIRKKSV